MSAPSSIEVFKRFAAGQHSTPPTPEPPFPPIPAAIKQKFPDLTEAWASYERAIAEWQKARQSV